MGSPENTVSTDRTRDWLRHLSGRRTDLASSAGELKRRLNRQLELLRDEIAQARRAGFSWNSIGAMVGLEPDTVRSIHAE
jgi:hypothetical protein